MSVVIVRSNPPRGFYSTQKLSILPDLSYRRLRAIPPYRRHLAESEIGSGSIELDNSDGFLSSIFYSPPFGIAVEVYNDAAELLIEGFLTAVEFQQSTAILRVEA